MGDLPLMYETFGEEFVHISGVPHGSKRRTFLGIIDAREDAFGPDEVVNSNAAEVRVRAIGGVGDFQKDDILEREGVRYRVDRVVVLNAEEVMVVIVS